MFQYPFKNTHGVHKKVTVEYMDSLWIEKLYKVVLWRPWHNHSNMLHVRYLAEAILKPLALYEFRNFRRSVHVGEFEVCVTRVEV